MFKTWNIHQWNLWWNHQWFYWKLENYKMVVWFSKATVKECTIENNFFLKISILFHVLNRILLNIHYIKKCKMRSGVLFSQVHIFHYFPFLIDTCSSHFFPMSWYAPAHPEYKTSGWFWMQQPKYTMKLSWALRTFINSPHRKSR